MATAQQALSITHLAQRLLPALAVLDEATNGIVCSAKVSFCFELDICFEAELRTAYEAVIAEFVLHLAEEDAASVHVRLRYEADTSN